MNRIIFCANKLNKKLSVFIFAQIYIKYKDLILFKNINIYSTIISSFISIYIEIK